PLEAPLEAHASAAPGNGHHVTLRNVVVKGHEAIVWNRTLGAWETGCGIDIGAVAGATHAHEHALVAELGGCPFERSNDDLAAARNPPGNRDGGGGHWLVRVRPNEAA